MYIILGLYVFGFNSADEVTSKVSYTAAVTTQAEQLAQTGVSMALLKLGSVSSASLTTQSKTTMGGTVTYDAQQGSLSSDQRTITSSATIGTSANAVTVTVKSVVHFDKNRWRVLRTYID